MEEEEIAKTQASDAKDGAFTPMKRKVADEAAQVCEALTLTPTLTQTLTLTLIEQVYEASIEASHAALKELEDAEDDLRRNQA